MQESFIFLFFYFFELTYFFLFDFRSTVKHRKIKRTQYFLIARFSCEDHAALWFCFSNKAHISKLSQITP